MACVEGEGAKKVWVEGEGAMALAEGEGAKRRGSKVWVEGVVQR